MDNNIKNDKHTKNPIDSKCKEQSNIMGNHGIEFGIVEIAQ